MLNLNEPIDKRPFQRDYVRKPRPREVCPTWNARHPSTAPVRSTHARSAELLATRPQDGTVRMRLIRTRTVVAPTDCQRSAAASVMPISIPVQYRRRRAKRHSHETRDHRARSNQERRTRRTGVAISWAVIIMPLVAHSLALGLRALVHSIRHQVVGLRRSAGMLTAPRGGAGINRGPFRRGL